MASQRNRRISGFLGFFLVLIAANALGIGAASFASVSGFGYGKRDLGTGTRSLSLSKCRVHILRERDGNIASKDIAESPTALPERPDQLSAISN